jgi:Pin2-interacting protein X1
MSKKFLAKLTEQSSVSKDKVKSTFGEKILKKMGWSQGEGLGKAKKGEIEPLQSRKRKENLGLGADPSKSKWNHNWWEELFNDTAQQINLSLPQKKQKIR